MIGIQLASFPNCKSSFHIKSAPFHLKRRRRRRSRSVILIILLLHIIFLASSSSAVPNNSNRLFTAANIWKSSFLNQTIMTTTKTRTHSKNNNTSSSYLHHNKFHGQRLHAQNTTCIMATSPSKPKPDSALKSFLSGGVGGICTVIVGHPFDLIKVKIQTSAQQASVFSMLTQTFQKEGIRGIYRGVSAPLVAISPMFAVSFWGYDMGKRIVQAVDERYIAKHTNNHIGQDAAAAAVAYPFTISQLCLAGGISALPTTLIMAPSERLKCLLQIHPERYSGLWDCAKKVYAEGGIQSVFRGTGATLLRDVPGSIAWFGTYELVKKGLMKVQKIDPESGALSPLAVLCAGGVAGMACWGVSIPADVLKSRFQTAPAGTYSGVMDVYRHLMKEEGPGALFRGLRPAMIRAFPANAACFFGMEVSKKAFAFMD